MKHSTKASFSGRSWLKFCAVVGVKQRTSQLSSTTPTTQIGSFFAEVLRLVVGVAHANSKILNG